MSPSALMAHARTDEGRKQLRYALVSVVFVPVGQALIQFLAYFAFDKDHTLFSDGTVVWIEDHVGIWVFEQNFTVASIVSAAILTFPNFFANKHFVWRDTASGKLRTQIIVFWVAAMLGVTCATLLTFVVEGWVKDQGLIESVAVFFAQLFGFGIVWVARYLVLDRWLFKVTHDGAEPTTAELAELHSELPI